MSLQPSWYPWSASFNQPTREAACMQKLCKCAEPHHISSHLIGITSLVVKNIMSNQEEDTGGRDRVNQSQLPSHQRHVTCNLLEHQIFKYQLEKMINCTTTILSFLQLQVKVYILTHYYPRQLDIKNKRKMRISFPEIQPWTWEKMMIELWIELRMRVKLLWQCGGRG